MTYPYCRIIQKFDSRLICRVYPGFSKFCESLSYVVSNIIKIDAIVEKWWKTTTITENFYILLWKGSKHTGNPDRSSTEQSAVNNCWGSGRYVKSDFMNI